MYPLESISLGGMVIERRIIDHYNWHWHWTTGSFWGNSSGSNSSLVTRNARCWEEFFKRNNRPHLSAKFEFLLIKAARIVHNPFRPVSSHSESDQQGWHHPSSSRYDFFVKYFVTWHSTKSSYPSKSKSNYLFGVAAALVCFGTFLALS